MIKSLHTKYNHMKERCSNPNNKSYHRYGGRGIKVCDEWLNDFNTFYDWSITNGWETGYSIERKDVNGNYCPENCKWIPLLDQAKNKTNTLYAELNGKRKRLLEWCEEFGLNPKTVYNRIYQYGMTPEEAITYKRKRGK